MPFKSKAQRAFLYAKHPEIAARWQAETPKAAKLPDKLHVWSKMKPHKEPKK